MEVTETVSGTVTSVVEVTGVEVSSRNLTFNRTLSTPTLDPYYDPSDDAVWILTSTFIIFTMQSGFGLLESGTVTTKNEVNIMVKNAVDVIIGGTTYWMFGYAFSFGRSSWSNPFCGWGYFFVEVDEEHLGEVYSQFFFQASFATTATTIVSGAMAERTKLESYIIFSALNTLVFCFPAHWVWAPQGWLKDLGFIDVAGDGPVHLVGGVTGLVSTLMLKPRHGRYDRKKPPAMGSPTNALLGMFMLWWGWLGFNCGSTFGISGPKWKLAARSAVATLSSSAAGGSVSLLLSYIFKKRKFDVGYIINGILGALVAITGLCAFAQPWEGVVIGAVGAVLVLFSIEFLDKLKIDDPVGCVGVHAVGGAWGILAVGLFARQDELRESLNIQNHHYGIFMGGGWYLLGVQMLGITSIIAWTVTASFIILKLIDIMLGLRMPLQHEILGADLVEHAVGDIEFDKVRNKIIGNYNQGHTSSLEEDALPVYNESRKQKQRRIYKDSLDRANYIADIQSDDEYGCAGYASLKFCSRCCGRTLSLDAGSYNLTSSSELSQTYGSVNGSQGQWKYNRSACAERTSALHQRVRRKGVTPIRHFRRAKSLEQRYKSRVTIPRRHTLNVTDLRRHSMNPPKTRLFAGFNGGFYDNRTYLRGEEMLESGDGLLSRGVRGEGFSPGNGELQVISSGMFTPNTDGEWAESSNGGSTVTVFV